MTDQPTGWSEADSLTYQQFSAVVVPGRLEQMTALLTLLPFGPDESFRVAELGCGEGFLAQALLTAFPNVELTALDGSAAMRAQAAARLEPFKDRVKIETFDLTATDWFQRLDGVDGVLSSLCVHHLMAEEKRTLFGVIGRRISSRGALLLADLVEPQRPEARELFAATWDRITEAQALAETGSRAAFDRFIATEWNYYRYNDPDDRPSPLFEQLLWLKEAGFTGVDCFWLQAGHAIYGGYKQAAVNGPRLSFEQAWQAAQAVLK